MIKRGEVGVAYRYTPEIKVNTLYGTEVVPKFHCRKCGAEGSKPVGDYYHGNKKKSKVRMGICILCDDERRKIDAKIKRRRDKGIHVDKNLEPLSNLEEFLC